MTNEEALLAVREMAAIWPQRALNEESVLAYAKRIVDLSAVNVALAIEQLAVSVSSMPSLQLLRQTAIEVEPEMRVPDIDQAWGEIKAEIHRVGSNKGKLNFSTGKPWQLQFSNPAVARIVDSIGWDEICGTDNEVAMRAHFLRMYEPIAKGQHRDQAVTPKAKALLEGLMEKTKMLPESATGDNNGWGHPEF